MILTLYEKDKLFIRKGFFQKAKPLWGGAYKNRIHQPGQLELSQIPLKYLKLVLVNLFAITPNGTKWLKVSKKPMSGTEWDSLWEVKVWSETNTCFQAVIHSPNLYYSKILKRKLKKEYMIYSGTGRNIISLLDPTNALWKDLMLHWLKLILNSEQDLVFFWQKQSLTGLLVTKIYKSRTMKISPINYSILGYIKLHCAQFPIIGNTYLELKRLKNIL